MRDVGPELAFAQEAVTAGWVSPETLLSVAQTDRRPDEPLPDALFRLQLLPDSARARWAEHGTATLAPVALPTDGWLGTLAALLSGDLETYLPNSSATEPATLATLAPDEFATVLPGAEGAPTTAGLRPATESRFRILRLHARGGLGQVSVAVDEELRREVALKEIQARYADDPAARLRFVREAEITGLLEHPGIVPVYGLGVDAAGRPYYAMRFIQGRSLKETLEAYHQETAASDRPVRFRELLRRFIDVCNAVEYAHSRGVIHRDLKPANVMLGPYGETLVVDWGLAKAVGERESLPSSPQPRAVTSSDDSSATLDGSALGTPQYMSPEQAAGQWSEVGPASDVFSLGATLYHVLTGRPPFTGHNVAEILQKVARGDYPPARSVRPDVPRPLDAVCRRALAARPAERYASARQLASEIENWMADEPLLAYREGAVERIYRWSRRHKAWTQGVATMLPLLLIVATTAAFVVDGARREALRQKGVAIDAQVEENKQRGIAEKNEKKAIENEQRAVAEEAKAVAARDDAQRSLANLLISSGDVLQRDGDLAGAALWYARALPHIASHGAAAETVHRTRLAVLLSRMPRPRAAWTVTPRQRARLLRPVVSPDGTRIVYLGVATLGLDAETGSETWPAWRAGKILTSATYSFDGRRIVTLGIPNEIRVWDAATGAPVTDVLQAGGRLAQDSVSAEARGALSRDGAFAAVLTTEPGWRIECWDVATGQRRFAPREIEPSVIGVQFTPDGSKLVVGTRAGLSYFDAQTGEPAGELAFEGLWAAAYSPDARWQALTSGDGHARLLDLATNELLPAVISHRAPVTGAVFSPDSTRVATLSSDRTVRLWEVPSGKIVGAPLEHSDRPFDARFDAAGARLLTHSQDNAIRVWDATTGRPLTPPFKHASFADAGFRGNDVVTATDGRAVVWDLSRSAQPGAIRTARLDNQSPAFVAPLPDGAVLLAGGSTAWVLDPAVAAWRFQPLEHGSEITALAASADGAWFATGGRDGSIKFWSAKTGAAAGVQAAHASAVTHLRFDRQGRRLLSSGGDTARLWTAADRTPIGEPLAHGGAVADVAFSPDGTLAATASEDGKVRLWVAETGAEHSPPREMTPGAASLPPVQIRFHPGGRYLLAADKGGDAVVWRLSADDQTDGETKEWRLKYGGPVARAEFSPDGRWLLLAGYANDVRVWDWAAHPETPIVLPSGFVSMNAAWHPGSQLAATVSFDGVRLWEPAVGRPVGPALGPICKALEFTADGRRLVTIDHQVSLWDVAPAPREPARIERLVQLLAGREIDPQGTLQYLPPPRLVEMFETLARESPAETKPQPGVTLAWPAP